MKKARKTHEKSINEKLSIKRLHLFFYKTS